MPNNAHTMQDDLRGEAQAWNRPDRSGFCQECGRVLTPGTLRHVGSGIFCIDCAAQAGDQPSWQSVYAGAPGAKDHRARSARTHAGPRPRLAAWLGLMPGVGAMYNGQYGKGAMHLAIFVALLAMADHVSDVLYWLVWGWVFYQAFDAYHTAVARRDGQPLPDPFGFNDVGGRFFGGTPGRPGSAQAPGPGKRQPFSSSTMPPYQTAPPPDTAAWNGENPYNAPYTRPSPAQQAASSPAYAHPAPYVPVRRSTSAPHDLMPTPLEGTRRFPVAALWLVGLGLVFLLGNLLPSWHFNGEWVAILAIALLAIWSAAHRWVRSRTQVKAGSKSLLCIFSFPAVLLLCCFLLVLDAAHVVTIARTWPITLVVWGALLFLQRVLPVSVSELPSTVPSTAADHLRPSPYDDDASYE